MIAQYRLDLAHQFGDLPGASHWVMMDEPEQVNRLMLGFLDPS